VEPSRIIGNNTISPAGILNLEPHALMDRVRLINRQRVQAPELEAPGRLPGRAASIPSRGDGGPGNREKKAAYDGRHRTAFQLVLRCPS